MTATIATVLAAIVTRDLADDLTRAVTFGGSYRPTVRVMLQRHWGECLDAQRLRDAAAPIRADLWIEASTGESHIGWRNNRDRVAYDRDMRALAATLKGLGLRVRHSYEKGLIVATRVSTDPATDKLVEAAAPLYIERINAAMALADAR